jgi:hypothetical protein
MIRSTAERITFRRARVISNAAWGGPGLKRVMFIELGMGGHSSPTRTAATT